MIPLYFLKTYLTHFNDDLINLFNKFSGTYLPKILSIIELFIYPSQNKEELFAILGSITFVLLWFYLLDLHIVLWVYVNFKFKQHINKSIYFYSAFFIGVLIQNMSFSSQPVNFVYPYTQTLINILFYCVSQTTIQSTPVYSLIQKKSFYLVCR